MTSTNESHPRECCDNDTLLVLCSIVMGCMSCGQLLQVEEFSHVMSCNPCQSCTTAIFCFNCIVSDLFCSHGLLCFNHITLLLIFCNHNVNNAMFCWMFSNLYKRKPAAENALCVVIDLAVSGVATPVIDGSKEGFIIGHKTGFYL